MCFIVIQVNWPLNVDSGSIQKVLTEGTVREFNSASTFLTTCEHFSSCLKDMRVVAIAPRSNHWRSGIVKAQNDSASAQLEWTGRRMSGMCEVCSHRINWLLWSPQRRQTSYKKLGINGQQSRKTTWQPDHRNVVFVLCSETNDFSVWSMTLLCHRTRAAL